MHGDVDDDDVGVDSVEVSIMLPVFEVLLN